MTPRTVTMTEQEILDAYYPHWQEQMRKVGKADQISPEACIEDWVVVHWASPVPSDLQPVRGQFGQVKDWMKWERPDPPVKGKP